MLSFRGAVGRATGGHIVREMTDAAPSPPDLAPAWLAEEIVPGVWQSGSPQPGEHWDAVIDLDGSAPPLEGIALYVHWLIEDGPAPERAVLIALADLVNDLRRARKRVLIHCAGGINRSGLLSAAALMRDGMSATEAIETVRSRRLGALNNREFVRLLIESL
jgi:dual specificity protein phosphatase-like protein